MKKWKVTYRDSDGDVSSVWCEASSKADAIEYTKEEYWDVDSIIECIPLR